MINIIRNKVFTFDRNKLSFSLNARISNATEIDKDKILVDDLIELVDKRMYLAKNGGRNKIISNS